MNSIFIDELNCIYATKRESPSRTPSRCSTIRVQNEMSSVAGFNKIFPITVGQTNAHIKSLFSDRIHADIEKS